MLQLFLGKVWYLWLVIISIVFNLKITIYGFE